MKKQGSNLWFRLFKPKTEEPTVARNGQSLLTRHEEANKTTKEFHDWFDYYKIKNFRADELLVKGASHFDRDSDGYRMNTDPPRSLWTNILPTIIILDRLRAARNAPIVISSAYRNPYYNSVVGGVSNSQHLRFAALDFVCFDGSQPIEWANQLRSWRNTDAETSAIGIGVYNTFVHLDVRDKHADWDYR